MTWCACLLDLRQQVWFYLCACVPVAGFGDSRDRFAPLLEFYRPLLIWGGGGGGWWWNQKKCMFQGNEAPAARICRGLIVAVGTIFSVVCSPVPYRSSEFPCGCPVCVSGLWCGVPCQKGTHTFHTMASFLSIMFGAQCYKDRGLVAVLVCRAV